MNTVLNLGIIGSTRGSNLVPLSLLLLQEKIPARIGVVISNKEDAGILERAKENGWPHYCIAEQKGMHEAYEESISEQLITNKTDLIILIGYMRILSPNFVKQWRQKILNVHPSLLPAFAGKMNEAVHLAVLQAGVPETGCSVHVVTEEVDAGPIVVQKKCSVYKDDTVATLKARVQSLEVFALAEAIQIYIKENSYAY
jgi:phosphoribosylglycinamide formyltransferase-1